MKPPGDVSERLQEAIAQRADALHALLAKYERAVACTELDVADDLRAHLAEQRDEIAVQVADAVLHWRRLGMDVSALAAFAPAPVPAALTVVPPVAEVVETPPVEPAAFVQVLPFPTAEVQVIEAEREAPTPTDAPAPQPEPPAPTKALAPAPDPQAAPPDADGTPPPVPKAPAPAKVTAESIVQMFGAVKAPPARPADLAALKHRLEGTAPVVPAGSWTPKLAALLRRIQHTEDVAVAMERLDESVTASDSWTVFPQDVQRLLLGLHAAWLRSLQDDSAVGEWTVTPLFSILTSYSKREQPGVVYGLARLHTPRGASWMEDADSLREQLADLVGADEVAPANAEKLIATITTLVSEVDRAPHPAAAEAVRAHAIREMKTALVAGVPSRDPRLVRLASPFVEMLTAPEFRGLRRAVREAADADAEEPDDVESDLPADWAWFAKTRGRRAVMVGGSPREVNRLRLERTFQFAELDWMQAEFSRNSLLGARNRVLAGKVDVMIILGRFVGHDADDIILPACRDWGVDWVHVEHGYGVARIRQAIERFLRS